MKPIITITVHLSIDELDNLKKLSVARKKTIEECIRDFARYALPGGTGYIHKGSVKDV